MIVGYLKVDGAELAKLGDHSRQVSLVTEKWYLGLGSSKGS